MALPENFQFILMLYADADLSLINLKHREHSTELEIQQTKLGSPAN